jgi:phage FluMu gp28-like protein
MPAPVDLYDYQKRWVNDTSRFKIGLWSRQTGKSFSTALEAVLDCDDRVTDWVFLSSGERQSKELMRKAKMHSEAMRIYCDEDISEQRTKDGTIYKQLEIIFRNRSRIMALPANPDTARGHSANVVLDEFAFHQDSRRIWQALFPTITRGFKIRIISTPQGKKNKFYEIWSGNPIYAKHRVTIHDAVAGGLPILDENGERTTPDYLRTALDDDEAWLQEYNCVFLDETTAFIPYELISQCERADLDEDENPWQGNPVYAGLDIGRKKDLTIFWAFEKIGDVLWSLKKIEMQNTSFSEQLDCLRGVIQELNPQRLAVDASGLGMQLGESLQEMFGVSRVELISFRNTIKEELAYTGRKHFEDHMIRIPISRRIREDIHAVKKVVTSAGNVRFNADHTKDGHSDRWWSLCLACHAAKQISAFPQILVGMPRQAPILYRQYGQPFDISAY